MNAIEEKLAEYCLNHKIIYSRRRKEVVCELAAAGGFVDAEALWLRILSRNKVKMSIGSVYLILNWLARLGFVQIEEDSGSKNKLFRININKNSNFGA